MGAFLAAFTTIAGALGKLADAASALVALKQSADMQRLGMLEQRCALLEAQNASLETRLAAVIAASGKSGSERL